MTLSEEKRPVAEKLPVLQSATLYKTKKWWSAVALLESFGRKQVAVYLWLNKDGTWKRQEKLIVHNKKEWDQIKENIEKLAGQLP